MEILAATKNGTSGGEFLPAIHYEGASFTKLQEQELVKALIMAAVKAIGILEQIFYVFLHKYGMNNIGVGGQMMSDSN